MEEFDLEDSFNSAVSVAKTVGEVIRNAFVKREKNVQTKAGMADLVTETDQLVEKMIIGTLKEKFPSHSFIGEESVAAGQKCHLTDNPTWVIDPIDGTTNFVHRFPYIAVSIGLLVNKEAVAGIIYNPILDEIYTAKKGQGAYCNGTKLQTSKTEDLSQALLCAEFGSSRDPAVLDSKFRSMRNVLNKCHGLRQVGSAALHMCQVASGTVDGHFSYGIFMWDIAAGWVIVREAGGVVLDTGELLYPKNFCLKSDPNLRSLGSAAINMCKVAAGSVDAYYEIGLHCWDMAAGDIIVREAGGVVIDVAGGPLDLMSRRVLCAGTAKIAQQIAQLIENIDFERD